MSVIVCERVHGEDHPYAKGVLTDLRAANIGHGAYGCLIQRVDGETDHVLIFPEDVPVLIAALQRMQALDGRGVSDAAREELARWSVGCDVAPGGEHAETAVLEALT